MAVIETYYLIDYENVGADGLNGCKQLTASDHIIIFFTENAKKIDMSVIADHGDAEIEMESVNPGKQSTDIHIGSYLGYLAGIYQGKECRAVIISKDTDFDNVMKFWQRKTKMKAARFQQIKDAKATATQNVTKKEPEKTKQKAETQKLSGEKRSKINGEIIRILSKAGYSIEAAGFVASTVIKHLGDPIPKQQINGIIHQNFDQDEATEICNLINGQY